MSVVIRLKVPIEMHYTVIPMGTSKVNSSRSRVCFRSVQLDSRSAIKSRTRATKLRDKITDVTSVLVDTSQWAWSVTAAFNVVIRKLTHESTQMQQSLSVYNILPGRSTYLFFQLYGAVDCYFR